MAKSDMRAGHDVMEDGVYANECCLAEVTLSKDQLFPRCPKCLQLCVWEAIDLPLQSAA